MKKEALFCDGTEAYVSPPEPEAGDELQLWFRTAAHDVDEVYLENRELCIPMNKVISNKAFDFYEVKYKLEDKPFRYHFKIRSGNGEQRANLWIIMILKSCRALRHRIGQKERSCIRFIQTASVTATRIMMYRRESTFILENRFSM